MFLGSFELGLMIQWYRILLELLCLLVLVQIPFPARIFYKRCCLDTTSVVYQDYNKSNYRDNTESDMRIYRLRNFYYTIVPLLYHNTVNSPGQYCWMYMVICITTPICDLGMLHRISYENDIAKKIL